MKISLILFTLFAASFCAKGQVRPVAERTFKGLRRVLEDTSMPVDSITKRVAYSEVIHQKGTAAQLYNAGLAYTIAQLPKLGGPVPHKDPEQRKIIINNVIPVATVTTEEGLSIMETYVIYQLTLQFRDGRYKYTIDNFRFMENDNTSYLLTDYIAALIRVRQRFISEHLLSTVIEAIEGAVHNGVEYQGVINIMKSSIRASVENQQVVADW